MLPGLSREDRGVEGQQTGALRDVGDDVDDGGDAVDALGELVDGALDLLTHRGDFGDTPKQFIMRI
jgi:hypothetical protein